MTAAHSALRLAVDTRAGGRPDRSGRAGEDVPAERAWTQLIEEDNGLNANDAWIITHHYVRKSWRALRPVAGRQVVQSSE